MSRPFATTTLLGVRMADLHLTATEVSQATKIHPRTLSNYLAGRAPILDHHLNALADCLDVPPESLILDEVL